MDPLLGTVLPTLSHLLLLRTAAPSVMGSFKVVERIRWLEFVELANLFIMQDIKLNEYLFVVHSYQLVYRACSRTEGKFSVIHNIMTWLNGLSRFMAVILSTEATSKEEAADLAAHQHVILQLYNNLGATAG